MSREGSRLSRLGVLAPAALSACMDASVLAVPAAGAIVSTVLKELSKAFMLKKWFHGSMSAKEAEHLMMERGKNGSFLVRESKSHPGEYVLSVRVRGRVSHVKIKKQDNKYDVGSGEKFEDLVGLIEHFRSYPMTESSGDVLRLLQPVSGTCIRGHDVAHKIHPVEDIDILDGSDKLSLDGEFRSLQMSHNPNMYTTNEGFKPENRCKNRYGNIIPYDQTRVVLRRNDDRHGNEYINANYIRTSAHFDSNSSVESSNESLDSVHSLIIRNERKKITPLVSKSLSDEALKEVKRCLKLDKLNGNLTVNKVKNKTYIASQGCLPNTKDDFWKMLWQEDVRVIVMLSNEYERGKKKCECYWPQTGREEVYDLITINNIGEHHYEDYIIRELVATDEKKTTKTIYHYQFTAWPDQGVPAEPDGVLAFIRDIDIRIASIMMSRERPDLNVLCVHCSAGVGRTGTFIVLDMLINKIKKTGSINEIDVYNTVQLVRTQRDGMVQNESQYKFIYTALRHYTDRGFSRHRK